MGKPAWVDDVTWARLGKKLDPDTMHGNLIQASVLLTVFELLKNAVMLAPRTIELPRMVAGKLMMTEFERGRLRPSPRYLAEVHEFNTLGDTKVEKGDYFLRGAMWLGKVEAVTADEVGELRELRDYRNEVAHELAYFLIDIHRTLDFNRYGRLVELLRKVERWHIRLELSGDPDYTGQDIKDEDMHSGSTMLADAMNRIVLRLAGVEA